MFISGYANTGNVFYCLNVGTFLTQRTGLQVEISKLLFFGTGNSMICSDIWYKYHEWFFEIVIRNFTAVRRMKFETILKYHTRYLCQVTRTIHAIICLYCYTQRFVILTCRFFKLSWNITVLSQSNFRNVSCSSITMKYNTYIYWRFNRTIKSSTEVSYFDLRHVC